MRLETLKTSGCSINSVTHRDMLSSDIRNTAAIPWASQLVFVVGRRIQ